jgi:hypothetical protein
VREDHLLPPDTEVPRQLEGGLRDHRQRRTPQVNMSWRSSAQAGDDVGTRRAPHVRRRRRRRQSGLRDGVSEDAGNQGHSLRGGDYWTDNSEQTYRA